MSEIINKRAGNVAMAIVDGCINELIGHLLQSRCVQADCSGPKRNSPGISMLHTQAGFAPVNSRLLVLMLLTPLTAVADKTTRGEAAIGDNLTQARQLFAASTSLNRRDCDPVGDGRWICASYINPTIQDFITREPGRYSGRPTAVMGNSLREAKRQFTEATILPRIDCDPIGSRWICASFNNPEIEDLTSDQSQGSGPLPTIISPPPTQTPSVPTDSPVNVSRQLPPDSLFERGDLLSLNYDSCPDPDDFHAAVSGKMVLDYFGLSNGSDYVVTNGTCGDLRPRSDYILNSDVVFDELYGNTWNDAFNFESLSISRVGNAYIRRLEAGYKVWVLDGGPMDFTSRVIAYMKGVGTSANLKNITVIQHSHGWNEQHTDPLNLIFLEDNVQYLTIDNGNHRNNRTPQLNQSNQQAAFPNVDPALVKRYQLDARYGDAWQLAFSMLSTANRFDGSDTVELLWALGLDSSDIADWYDFADTFLTASLPAEKKQPTPDVIGGPVDATDPLPLGDFISPFTIRLEAESATLSSEWAVETTRPDYSSAGYIRWVEGNRYQSPGDGIVRYGVVPEVSGTYTLRLRARAIDPPKSDLNNDVWIRMNGDRANGSSDLTDWVKVFTTGQDSWQIGGTVDKSHSMELFKQNLTAGTLYTFEISGRSYNYAIDYFELTTE